MPDDFRYPGLPKNWPQIQAMRRIWHASARLRALHQPHFKAIGMPMVEFDLLSTLGNTEGLRMKNLAESMMTTPSNVTRVCTKMEKQGLVKRERSSDSDREVIARLTPEGERLFAELFPKTVNYSSRIMDTGLSAEEFETVAALLDKLLAQVRDPDPEG